MVKVREDMTGWKMAEHGVVDSRWTVIERADDYITPNGFRYAQWLCECNCDNKTRKVVSQTRLRSGISRSCGCLQRQQMSERRKKENKRDLSGEYGILWTTNTNEEVYFDLEDAERILQHTWFKESSGYVASNINGKMTRLHVFLGLRWHDHHNRNKLDNRKENLISCTQQENNTNASIRSNNSSGVIGVYFNKDMSKWTAQVNDSKNHTKNLGSFINIEDAIRVRLQAEAKYYGEFSPQKHLFEQYKIKVESGDVN